MTAKQSVYLETTIPSFLAARPARDIVLAGEQEITRQWWDERSDAFELWVSELVLSEAAKGDADAARRRIESVAGLPLLEIDEETIWLTEKNSFKRRNSLQSRRRRWPYCCCLETRDGLYSYLELQTHRKCRDC